MRSLRGGCGDRPLSRVPFGGGWTARRLRIPRARCVRVAAAPCLRFVEPALVSWVPPESGARAGGIGRSGRASGSSISRGRGSEDDWRGIRPVPRVRNDAARGPRRSDLPDMSARSVALDRRVRVVAAPRDKPVTALGLQKSDAFLKGPALPNLELVSQLTDEPKMEGTMQRGPKAFAISIAAAMSLLAGCGGGGSAQQKPAGMPPDVAAEMQKRMGSVTGPGSTTQGGSTAAPAPK